MSKQKNILNSTGFTIVELLIVIVVIAILAAISIVSYRQITTKAYESNVKSNLGTAAKQIEIDKLRQGSYASSLSAINGNGVSGSDTVTYTYIRTASGYCLTGSSKKNATIVFSINQNGSIKTGACTETALATTDACFTFNASSHPPARTIIQYNDNENSDALLPLCPKDVIIPSTIGGVTVEAIGENSFENKGIRTVVVPTSVQLIDMYAFANNPQMTSASVPVATEVMELYNAFDAQVVVTRY